MALTDVQICANALIRLGAQPIQSFSEETDLAAICSSVYPIKMEYLLSVFPWNFSLKFVQLSRMTTPPDMQYQYQFALPADRVIGGFPAVYLDNTVSSSPISDYRMVGNVLLANEDEIWVEYQYMVNEALWPYYFTELMINVMKAELCFIVTENSSYCSMLQEEVFGNPSDMNQGGLLAQAMFLDSRDNPTQQIADFSLIDARFGGI